MGPMVNKKVAKEYWRREERKKDKKKNREVRRYDSSCSFDSSVIFNF